MPEINSQNFHVRSFNERVAMNMPIQGTAADIIKIAMINVDRRLKAEGLDARMILQVHDELIIEAHRDSSERAAEILRDRLRFRGRFHYQKLFHLVQTTLLNTISAIC